MREISLISEIQLSVCYFIARSRKVTMLDSEIREMIKLIASERQTYSYRRIWIGNQE